MKKTLPLIIILISLSLLGLIFMQASWLNNLLELRGGQVLNKVREVGVGVVEDIRKAAYHGPTIRFPKRPGLGISSDFLKMIKPQTIGDRYSKDDIYKKLRNGFETEDLKHLQFEFAVSDNNDELEMQTNAFVKAFTGTSSSDIFFGIII